MTDKPKTKADIGCEYIAKHPGCRTPELAEVLGVHPKNVHANLAAPIRAGYILTCLVKRPGQQDVTEFRISATVGGDQAPEWKKFQVARMTEAKQLKAAKKTPPTRIHQHHEAATDQAPAAPIQPASKPAEMAVQTPETTILREKLAKAHTAIEQFCVQVMKLTDGRLPLNLNEALTDLQALLKKPKPQASADGEFYTYALHSELTATPEQAMERATEAFKDLEDMIIVTCRPAGRLVMAPKLVPMESAS
ncbi:MAG: hypothetical protein H6R18_1916 [Proteobacteria bacterium]|nr:hypothetical protein [Pseudomonadota bacterium]